MLRRVAFALCLLVTTPQARAAPQDPGARIDRYFAIWADNASIKPETVAKLYASRVVYYGKPMTPDAVYRDKLAFVRRWPSRRYGIVPGSLGRACDPGEHRCRVTAILSWARVDARERSAAKGANTITLDLVREGGALKIARESGTPVASADCRTGSSGWRCAAYR